mmetsp:Transcript_65203/g.201857  ORF Transcript_65203/g.201857 Transcript_65203/m.201857 type:complete len:378 (+) Transcript_65203:357-1490(+)
MHEVASLQEEYADSYGEAFSDEVRDKGHEYAAALQSTRLAECVRLIDLILPFGPWLVWPILQLYVKDGMAGFVSLLLHGIAVAGLYAVLQSFGHLPSYLDSEYPVLRSCPRLLSWVLVLHSVPWASAARAMGILGAMHSSFRFLVALPRLCRPVGDTVGQLVNLELKLNMLLQQTSEIAKEQRLASARSEAALRQQLVSAALGLATHGACGDSCAGTAELLKGLSVATELCKDGGPLHRTVGKPLQRRANTALLEFDVPAVSRGFCRELRGRDVMGCALRGDLQQLLEHLVAIAEAAPAAGAEGSEGSEDDEGEALQRGHPRQGKKEDGHEEVSTRDDSDDKAVSEAEEQRAGKGAPGARHRRTRRADWQDYEHSAS